jgi:putative hemolysin
MVIKGIQFHKEPYLCGMELFIILLLVLLNGIFAMSEMSLVSSKKFKLENAVKKGSVGARNALDLSEHPTRFLSTVQIGITLIGILLGVYSGENLTNDVVGILENIEIVAPYAKTLSTLIIVFLVTYMSIVLGELLPKRLGMAFPEPIITVLAGPMKILSTVTAPFVWLLTKSNDVLLAIMGLHNSGNARVTEEEIKSIVREGVEGGEIEHIEHSIVERVFELGDRKVNTLFTHRKDIVFFRTADSWEEILEKIGKEKHAVYPVTAGNSLDDTIGIVMLKDLFQAVSKQPFDIREYIRKPLYLNENVYAYKILELFKKHKMHYAIVVDEYGSTVGMVTMDDVVDALVGDVSDEDQEEYEIIQRDENSWLVDGQYSVIEFVKYFKLDMDYNANQTFTTVAGLIIYKSNKLPDVGEKIYIEDFVLEVIDKDRQRIDKVLVTRNQ